MKKASLLLMAAFIGILLGINSSFAGEYVWGKTKWGMSPQEFSKAVGKEFVSHRKNKKGDLSYEINKYIINNMPFNIYAQFHDNKLISIVLIYIGNDNLREVAESIAFTIDRRIGKQDSSTINNLVYNVIWSTDETYIELICCSGDIILYYSKKLDDGTSPF